MSRRSVTDGPGFDVVGDVHGCFTKLVALLVQLGYSDESGAFRHPTRQVVFVGDLIDRGREQVKVLGLVRSMVEAGTAMVAMGNHEFNAIAYATPHPSSAGEYLRPHTDKNKNQHAEFLDQIGWGSADHDEAIEWFGTFPLWLDLDGLRVVHACWDAAAMAGLGSAHVGDELVVAASTTGDDAYRWVENLCKGPEVRLPDGYSFQDKDGHERVDARLRWWDAGRGTYATACEVPQGCVLPDIPIRDLPVDLYGDDVPVIFGHYWRHWPNFEMTSTTACIDYSAVNGGPLVAYRWSGEVTLRPGHLVPSG